MASKAYSNTYTTHLTLNNTLILTISNYRNSHTILVDESDYEELSMYHWTISTTIKNNMNGIICGALHGVTLGMLLMNPFIKSSKSVIHVNGDNHNFRKINLAVVPKGVRNLTVYTRFVPTLNNQYHPNIKTVTLIRDGISYEYVRVGFNGLIKFVKVFSVKRYGIDKAMQLANDTAIQVHEEFLSLPENKHLVQIANN